MSIDIRHFGSLDLTAVPHTLADSRVRKCNQHDISGYFHAHLASIPPLPPSNPPHHFLLLILSSITPSNNSAHSLQHSSQTTTFITSTTNLGLREIKPARGPLPSKKAYGLLNHGRGSAVL